MNLLHERQPSTTHNELFNAITGGAVTDVAKNLGGIFGIRSLKQLKQDIKSALSHQGAGFQVGVSSLGFIRPDISLPTYRGKRPENALAPIYHCFDRTEGGKGYSQRVTRKTAKDFRGKKLTYDEHDGVDFVCPIGTELVAAAPGRVVMIRDTWLRGGLTIGVDHGFGYITQYTHCWKSQVSLGQELKRGDVVALSGASGLDMTLFFPWIPPHIHFMIWKNGMPMDPFITSAEGENENALAGTWFDGSGNGMPCHDVEGALQKEEVPAYSTVDIGAINKLIPQCKEQRVVDELNQLEGNYPALAALLEDSLHHDKWAWDDELRGSPVRLIGENETPSGEGDPLRLTLPLTPEYYRGAFFADDKIPNTHYWV